MERDKREQVIKALEEVIAEAVYPDRPRKFMMSLELAEDALALLKAREPVKPVVDIDTWKCGNCGHALEHQKLLGDNVLFHEQYNYCPECGRAVKWE